MTKLYQWIFYCLIAGFFIVYAFVSAPPPLDEKRHVKSVSIRRVLEIMNQENQLVRSLYTKEIVGPSKKQGIRFDENWADEDINAGILPAQFLRETARYLERSPVPLGLFLGSDYAINRANGFEGEQLKTFQNMRNSKSEKYFFDKGMERYVYMFPDVAVAPACISCHNNHPNSPKKNWVLGDMMGATTWTYPDQDIEVEDVLLMISSLRQGFRSAYEITLKESAAMDNPPVIGTKWPKGGRFLPSADVFMDELSKRASTKTLISLSTLGKEDG